MKMEKALPLISVGLPTFNGSRWLESSVGSILSQSLGDFELIICDNASTDDTEAVCQKLAAQDSRIRYYRHAKNLGVVQNYNAVVKFARGKYFKWVSCNDYCAPDFFSRCSAELEQRPDVVLCCPSTRIFTNTIENAQDYDDHCDLPQERPSDRHIAFRRAIQLNNIMNGFIRMDALKKTRLLKDFYASDINLMAELTLHGKFVQLDDRLFYRRMSPEAATKYISNDALREFYHPDNLPGLKFPLWRFHTEYLAGITRAPISIAEKIRLYIDIIGAARWDRSLLADEIIDQLKTK